MSGRRGFDGVALAAPVSFGYTRFSERPAAWFIGRALAEACDAAGIAKDRIDGLAMTSLTLAPDTAVGLTEHLGLAPRWLENIPFGGASAVVGAMRAARAVQAGDAEIVAVIGGETNGPDTFAEIVANFSSFSKAAVWPHGAPGPNGVYALITQAYMDAYGTERADFGRLAVEQRAHAQGYEQALIKKPLDLDGYLAARPIVPPVHLFDCVMPCAGAEAFLVMRADTAAAEGLPHARLSAGEERYNAFADDPIQLRGGWDLFVDDLYAAAGCGPRDVDALYTYDDYPVMCFVQMEGLGFCRPGETAAWFAGPRETAQGRRLLHNSSGGQLSAGQAGFAGGHLGFVEALRQVAGVATGRQHPVRRALVSGYGMVNYDRGLCACAAMLERAGAA